MTFYWIFMSVVLLFRPPMGIFFMLGLSTGNSEYGDYTQLLVSLNFKISCALILMNILVSMMVFIEVYRNHKNAYDIHKGNMRIQLTCFFFIALAYAIFSVITAYGNKEEYSGYLVSLFIARLMLIPLELCRPSRDIL